MNEGKKVTDKISFSCPVCGRKTDYPVEEMVERAILNCPFCKLNLTLHGHMWRDIEREIEKLGKKQ